MGRLLEFEEIKDEKSWYFTDDCYEYVNFQGPYLKWPNPCYPYYSTIKVEILEDKEVKIKIRKWIERCIPDNVFIRAIDKSYRVYYGKEPLGKDGRRPYDMWDKSFEVNNRWLAFYFEDSESALAFKLKFGDIISEVIEREPEHLDKITENHGR